MTGVLLSISIPSVIRPSSSVVTFPDGRLILSAAPGALRLSRDSHTVLDIPAVGFRAVAAPTQASPASPE